MDWVIEELARLSFGDKRLDKRAQKILTKLSRNATDSIPAACDGAAETKATARMEKQPIVLIPQDTTVLNFNTQYERKDTGPTTKDSAKGMQVHCAIAVTPDKVCLGIVSRKQWHREELQKLTRAERNKKDYSTSIENKGSYRWLENYKKANEVAAALPNTMLVSVADREGDIYEIYKEANKIFSTERAKAHFLIRAKTNRRACSENGKKTSNKIKETLKNENPLGKITIHVAETKKRKAREAHMTIYSKSISIAWPDKLRKERPYKPIKVK